MGLQNNSCSEFSPKPLPYNLNALEPYINEETLTVHYEVLYKRYVDNLNKALANNPKYYCDSPAVLLQNISNLPPTIARSVFNNAGGTFNHEFYFFGMQPAAYPQSRINQPISGGRLATAMDKYYGNFENFKKQFTDMAMAVFGSGWTWLCCDRDGALELRNTANQVTPYAVDRYPILCIDIWEHAYFLQYEAGRNYYIENWFNLINWQWAEANYLSFA